MEWSAEAAIEFLDGCLKVKTGAVVYEKVLQALKIRLSRRRLGSDKNHQIEETFTLFYKSLPAGALSAKLPDSFADALRIYCQDRRAFFRGLLDNEEADIYTCFIAWLEERFPPRMVRKLTDSFKYSVEESGHLWDKDAEIIEKTLTNAIKLQTNIEKKQTQSLLLDSFRAFKAGYPHEGVKDLVLPAISDKAVQNPATFIPVEDENTMTLEERAEQRRTAFTKWLREDQGLAENTTRSYAALVSIACRYIYDERLKDRNLYEIDSTRLLEDLCREMIANYGDFRPSVSRYIRFRRIQEAAASGQLPVEEALQDVVLPSYDKRNNLPKDNAVKVKKTVEKKQEHPAEADVEPIESVIETKGPETELLTSYVFMNFAAWLHLEGLTAGEIVFYLQCLKRSWQDVMTLNIASDLAIKADDIRAAAVRLGADLSFIKHDRKYSGGLSKTLKTFALYLDSVEAGKTLKAEARDTERNSNNILKRFGGYGLDALNLRNRLTLKTTTLLYNNGIDTVGAFLACKQQDFLDIEGIGRRTSEDLAKVVEAILNDDRETTDCLHVLEESPAIGPDLAPVIAPLPLDSLKLSAEASHFLKKMGIITVGGAFSLRDKDLKRMNYTVSDVVEEILEVRRSYLSDIEKTKALLSFVKYHEALAAIAIRRFGWFSVDRLPISPEAAASLIDGGVYYVSTLLSMSENDIRHYQRLEEGGKEEVITARKKLLEGNCMMRGSLEEYKALVAGMRLLKEQVKKYSLSRLEITDHDRRFLTKENVRTMEDFLRFHPLCIILSDDRPYAVALHLIQRYFQVLRGGKGFFAGEKADFVLPERENGGWKEDDERGLDFSAIEILRREFGLTIPVLASWLSASEEAISQALRNPGQILNRKWTATELSEAETATLQILIRERGISRYNGDYTGYLYFSSTGEIAAVFVYPEKVRIIWERFINGVLIKKIHDAFFAAPGQERESGEDGQTLVFDQRMYWLPRSFQTLAKKASDQNIPAESLTVLQTGLPLVDDRFISDEKVVRFLRKHQEKGTISCSGKEMDCLRILALRSGLCIGDFIRKYGFEPEEIPAETLFTTEQRHKALLSQYTVSENKVYLMPGTPVYERLNKYAAKKNQKLGAYLGGLGLSLMNARPSADGTLDEEDMQPRNLEDSSDYYWRLLASNPFLGDARLTEEDRDYLGNLCRVAFDRVMEDTKAALLPKEERAIVFMVVDTARGWNKDQAEFLWGTLGKNLGYSEAIHQLDKQLMDACDRAVWHVLTESSRFVIGPDDISVRMTILLHAMVPYAGFSEGWFTFVEALFAFYSKVLHWEYKKESPLLRRLRDQWRRILTGSAVQGVLVTDSPAYGFPYGLRVLLVRRPKTVLSMMDRVLTRIQAAARGEKLDVLSQLDELTDTWYRRYQSSGREKAVKEKPADSAVRVTGVTLRYLMKNETEVCLQVSDFRVRGSISALRLQVLSGQKVVYREELSWFAEGEEKKVQGTCFVLPSLPDRAEFDYCVQVHTGYRLVYDSKDRLFRQALFFSGEQETAGDRLNPGLFRVLVPSGVMLSAKNAALALMEDFDIKGVSAYVVTAKKGFILQSGSGTIAADRKRLGTVHFRIPEECAAFPPMTVDGEPVFAAFRRSSLVVSGDEGLSMGIAVYRNDEMASPASFVEQSAQKGVTVSIPLAHDRDPYVHIRVVNLYQKRTLFEKTFLLADSMEIGFDRPLYFSNNESKEGHLSFKVEHFFRRTSFDPAKEEVSVIYSGVVLNFRVPKVMLDYRGFERKQTVFIDNLPAEAEIHVEKPSGVRVRFYLGENELETGKNGVLSIGTILHSLTAPQNSEALYVEAETGGKSRRALLTTVFFKEGFLYPPFFTLKGQLLSADFSGFCGKPGRTFTVELQPQNGEKINVKMAQDGTAVVLTDEPESDDYQYTVSVGSGGLFRARKEVLAVGWQVLGDINPIRFRNRRIILESVTDGSVEDASWIQILPCYVDNLEFIGLEAMSEGVFPLYRGVLYREREDGSRYEFSFNARSGNLGTLLKVNPVRVLVTGKNILQLTDEDGDGLYFFRSYDSRAGHTVYQLTDRGYTRENRLKYAVADACIFYDERLDTDKEMK